MDCDKLITCVKRRSALWDRKTKLYFDRDNVRQNWKEVAQELKGNEEKIRYKWKALRDQFRRELQKTQSEAGAPCSKWRFFNDMLFLKDQFKIGPKKNSNIEEMEDGVEALTSTEESQKEPTDAGYNFAIETTQHGMNTVEKLIESVKRHPVLWDKRHEAYSDRHVREENWIDLACELREKEQKLREKWKALRDTFRRELQKTQSEDGAPCSKWAYFNDMLFLKDQFQFQLTKKYNKINMEEIENGIKASTSTEESHNEKSEDEIDALTSTEDSQEEPAPIKKIKIERDYSLEKLFIQELQTEDDSYSFGAESTQHGMNKVEKLIESVKRHPVLWDKRHKYYSDRHVREKNWIDLSCELREKEEKIRYKWKALRDQFRRELQKTQSEDDAPCSKWRLFNDMLFLKDQFKIGPKKKRYIEEMEDGVEALTSTEESQKETTPIKKEVKRDYDMENIFLLENEIPVSLKEKPDQQIHDDDYHFAMSIIPYMREVPPGQKLQLRTMIQQLIMDKQRSSFAPAPISGGSSSESADSPFSTQH